MNPPPLPPERPRPAAVFFDLGQVLCGFDWKHSLARLSTLLENTSEDEIIHWLLGSAGPHDPYCCGEISEEQLWTAIHERYDPARKLEDDILEMLWCDMFTPFPESLKIVDELKGQCHRGLISNTNRLHFEHLDGLLHLRERMDSITLSHEVGVLKPDPRIFSAALKSAGKQAADSIFIDDIAAFAQAAEELGWRAIHFQSSEKLREQMSEMGFFMENSPSC